MNKTSTSPRHIAIVCNTKSGKGKPLKLLPQLEGKIREHSLTFQSYTETLPPNLDGFTDLIIMGGDGTLNYTLNHFPHINIPVGLIRCGTGNDFTELLFGTKTIEQHIETAINGTPQPVDAGSCNGRLFLNGVGIGFDGWVVKRLLAKKLFSGKAAYYSTVISLLLFYKEQPVTLQTSAGTHSFPLFMLSAANGRSYGGGFNVAPRALVNDGLLDILSVKKISLFNRLKYLPVIEKGNHLNKPLPFIQFQLEKHITLASTQPLQAHLDGEYMIANSFEIKILPSYLWIRQ